MGERIRVMRCGVAGLSLVAAVACAGATTNSPATTTSGTTAGTTPGTTKGTAVVTGGTLPAGTTIASTMVFGSGSECPNEPYCLPGLRATYGLEFKDFVVTDSGGAKTRAALQDGSIQIGVLFTSDPHVSVDGFVLLDDDQHLQPAENITPVVRDELVTAHGDALGDTVNAVSAKLTTAKLVELNEHVQIDGVSAADAATTFLRNNGLIGTEAALPGSRGGPTIVVGSANFSENATLAELYAQALVNAGFPVERRFSIGNRSTYFPLVQSGEVGFVPEYVGSLLGYLDPDATESADSIAAHDTLLATLAGTGLTAFEAAPAEDKNGIAVTAATASRYGLTKVSDLARPA